MCLRQSKTVLKLCAPLFLYILLNNYFIQEAILLLWPINPGRNVGVSFFAFASTVLRSTLSSVLLSILNYYLLADFVSHAPSPSLLSFSTDTHHLTPCPYLEILGLHQLRRAFLVTSCFVLEGVAKILAYKIRDSPPIRHLIPHIIAPDACTKKISINPGLPGLENHL